MTPILATFAATLALVALLLRVFAWPEWRALREQRDGWAERRADRQEAVGDLVAMLRRARDEYAAAVVDRAEAETLRAEENRRACEWMDKTFSVEAERDVLRIQLVEARDDVQGWIKAFGPPDDAYDNLRRLTTDRDHWRTCATRSADLCATATGNAERLAAELTRVEGERDQLKAEAELRRDKLGRFATKRRAA